MLVHPQMGNVRCQHNTGSVGTATIGTSVTTGGSAGTKGSVAQLIASTNFDSYLMYVIVDNYAAATTASRGAVDIMVGAATENILIPNLLFVNAGGIASTAKHGPKIWMFPLYIAAGTRISAQACGDRTSTALGVSVYLYGGHMNPLFRVGGRVDTYGIGSLPAGTLVTVGASGSEGSWTQITASTTVRHFCVVPSFQIGGTTLNLRNTTLDIGVGAATESMIAEGYWFPEDSNEALAGPFPPMPCFTDIPAGTRLAARISTSGTSDGSVYEVALHCVS